MTEMQTKNPFKKIDHIREQSPDLKDRVMRSAEKQKALMALASLFTDGYIGSFLSMFGVNKNEKKNKKST